MYKLITNTELTNIFITTFPGLNVLLETPSTQVLQENTLRVFPTSFGVLFEENPSAEEEDYQSTNFALSGAGRILSIYPAINNDGKPLKVLPCELKVIVPPGCLTCIISQKIEVFSAMA